MTQDEIDALNASILANATKPQSASVDGTSVTQQSADDEMKRAAYSQQQGITVAQLFGNRTRLIPGPRQ